MPLDADQELLEHELRVEQMKTTIDAGRVNIEKLRADMLKMQADTRWEIRKFAVQLILGTAAALGAGVALANYVNGKAQPVAPPMTITAPPPQIIYVLPGQAPPPVPR